MERIVQIQKKCKQQKQFPKNWNHKFQRKKVTPNEIFLKSNYNNSNIEHIKNYNIKFIWKFVGLIFNIIINFISFFWKF